MLRHKARHSDRNGVGVPAGQPRHVLGTSPLLNLVESQPGKVNVTCLLTREGRIWGRHGQDEAAVMHLSIKAKEPIGLRLKGFELEISLVTGSASAAGTRNSSETLPSSVWHLVAPGQVLWRDNPRTARTIEASIFSRPVKYPLTAPESATLQRLRKHLYNDRGLSEQMRVMVMVQSRPRDGPLSHIHTARR